MLRVAMITDHFAFAGKVDGGVQAVTKYLVDAIVHTDSVDLHVVCFGGQSDDLGVVERDGFTRHVLPTSRFGTLTAFRNDQHTLNKRLRAIMPDVVHGQGAGRNGILAARSPYPSIITIHGILAEEAQFFASPKRRLQHRALAYLSNHYCIRRASHTILISPYVADYYSQQLGGQKHLIPNPIADDFFAVPRNAEPGRIFFAGRLLPLKGVKELVRAASRLADSQSIKLILAGSLDQTAYVREVRAEADALGLREVVEFRGLLDDSEIRRELELCCMLVLPSYQETAPMVIAEAMAAGVPVVASDVGGVRYQIDDGKTGYLVKPGDVAGLARTIDQLLSSPEMLQTFGDNARKDAGNRYRAARVAEQTIDAYKTVLSANGDRQ